MKSNKTLLLAALVASSLLACGTVRAQDSMTNSPSTNAAPRMIQRPSAADRIGKYLGLTDDQKAKFQTIYDGEREKMRAVFQDNTLSTDDKRAKANTIRDDTTAQLKDILTPDQFDKWNKMQTRGRRMMAPPPTTTVTNAPAAPAPAPATPGP
jgi:hypothetical protein